MGSADRSGSRWPWLRHRDRTAVGHQAGGLLCTFSARRYQEGKWRFLGTSTILQCSVYSRSHCDSKGDIIVDRNMNRNGLSVFIFVDDVASWVFAFKSRLVNEQHIGRQKGDSGPELGR